MTLAATTALLMCGCQKEKDRAGEQSNDKERKSKNPSSS
jgi:hypothetical protein